MSNIQRIQNAMTREGLRALLLTDELDCRYASGFHASNCEVLILQNEAFYITDSRYTEAAEAKVKGAKVLQSSHESPVRSIVSAILKGRGISQLGVQEHSLSYAQYVSLEQDMDVSFKAAQGITQTLRQVKSDYERECIIAAQGIAETALDYVLGWIKEGVTEREVAAELEYRMARAGGEGLAFETICISGENTSQPHGVPTNRRLRAGDLITMDFGCKINGYCSDMTRTVALGKITDRQRQVYETVLAAQNAAIGVAKAGISGSEVDKAAREIIANAGYGEFFGHSTGHSVGLFIHEGPNASPSETRLLPAGAVITCEPGIYLPGRFGVRIEDMLFLTESGNENLTKAAKNLIIL